MNQLQMCNCIGPQNGQPLCPCMMRGVTQIDGRYIKTQDLGPVVPEPIVRPTCPGCSKHTQRDWRLCPHCGITLNPST
jgi:hypothetical protein